jgi:hypothetical protein
MCADIWRLDIARSQVTICEKASVQCLASTQYINTVIYNFSLSLRECARTNIYIDFLHALSGESIRKFWFNTASYAHMHMYLGTRVCFAFLVSAIPTIELHTHTFFFGRALYFDLTRNYSAFALLPSRELMCSFHISLRFYTRKRFSLATLLAIDFKKTRITGRSCRLFIRSLSSKIKPCKWLHLTRQFK